MPVIERASEAAISRAIDGAHAAHQSSRRFLTRNGKQAVVMLSLEDYQALEETACLLRNPANAKRLLSATAQLSAGKGEPNSP